LDSTLLEFIHREQAGWFAPGAPDSDRQSSFGLKLNRDPARYRSWTVRRMQEEGEIGITKKIKNSSVPAAEYPPRSRSGPLPKK
jgi:hypothetical protein